MKSVIIILLAVLTLAAARPPLTRRQRILCSEQRAIEERQDDDRVAARQTSNPSNEGRLFDRKSLAKSRDNVRESAQRKRIVPAESIEEYGLVPNFAQNSKEAKGLFSPDSLEHEERQYAAQVGRGRSNINGRAGMRNNGGNFAVHPRGSGSEEGGQWEEFTPSKAELREATKSLKIYESD